MRLHILQEGRTIVFASPSLAMVMECLKDHYKFDDEQISSIIKSGIYYSVMTDTTLYLTNLNTDEFQTDDF